MITLLIAVGAIYLLFVAALYGFQRRLMYVPFGVAPPPAAAGVPEMRPVGVETDDGLRLLAWWAAPRDGAAPVLVYFHGNAGHLGLRSDKLRPFLDAGIGALLLAYRGFSGNPGSPTEEGLYRDARAAVRFVAAAGIPAERIILYGESLGSGIAVQMATEHRVGAVVLEAPFTSITDLAAARFPFVPVRWLLKDRYESAAKIALVSAPILIFAGGRDQIVPPQFARRLFEAANEPKELRFIEGATHLDFYEHGAPRTVLEFLARHMPDRLPEMR